MSSLNNPLKAGGTMDTSPEILVSPFEDAGSKRDLNRMPHSYRPSMGYAPIAPALRQMNRLRLEHWLNRRNNPHDHAETGGHRAQHL